MPKRPVFQKNSYYHVFNRGIDKRTIFIDNQDHKTFLDILRYYLKFEKKHILNAALKRTGLVHQGLFNTDIQLLAYCLMPNHFHLLVFQKDKEAVSNFVRRISVTYSMYFNRKYERKGSLFEGRFKAKHIDTDEYLLQCSKYIHANPLKQTTRPGLVSYPWSSLKEYVNSQTTKNLSHTQTILEYFEESRMSSDYLEFVTESENKDPDPQYFKWLN